MKIAVVGPSPVPFGVGGMEKLVWDLVEKINCKTPHQAELIKLPSRENDFWSIIDTYRSFYQLDLSHFDMVISTKYPSWMVSHKNHVCYMVHKLRGLYDTYSLTGLSLDVNTKNVHTIELIKFLNDTWDNPNIDQLWINIDRYRSYASEVPLDDLAFPGPLIRKIVHYMDRFALSDGKIRGYYTMSKTVASRTDYFPDGTHVAIANPPPTNDSIGAIEYGDYFFTVSRLDNAKRVKLIVEAMKTYKGKKKLIIAGTGPDEHILKEIAGSDDRIIFKGYCSDEEISKLYDGCFAVLYVPYQEDYGYVTVEAFLRCKPVITCTDSGGATEFVSDGESGHVVIPDPASISLAMKHLEDDPGLAKALGRMGRERTKNITWDLFLKTILPSTATVQAPARSRRKRKIIVTSTFPIYPPTGGGQSRIFNLYKNVAKSYDVIVLSFTNYDQPPFDDIISPGFREIRIPKSARHQEEEWKIERDIGVPITDIVMPQLSKYTPEYGETLRNVATDADVVIISHPYLYDEVRRINKKLHIIYEAHNVEYDLKSKVLPQQIARKLIDEVYRVEKACCDESDLIMTCLAEDARRLVELYSTSQEKFIVVPNGVDVTSVPYVSRTECRGNKLASGIENEFIALFMGSWHPPNLEACEDIFHLAESLPDVKFLLLGSQCMALKDRQLPSNVGLLGVVDDAQKSFILGLVDVALNPMRSGSGTNLKMFDYIAAGVPVITTKFGARGLNIDGEKLMEAEDLDAMKKLIVKLADSGPDESDLRDLRRIAELYFDWAVIADLIDQKIEGILAEDSA